MLENGSNLHNLNLLTTSAAILGVSECASALTFFSFLSYFLFEGRNISSKIKTLIALHDAGHYKIFNWS